MLFTFYFLRIKKLCRRDVRLFVLVLCPLTGNPFKCRLPRTLLISISRLIFKLTKRFKSPSSLNSSVSKMSRKEEIFVSPFNDAAKDTHNSYFEFITTIPNVNNLSEEELRYVRQSFTEKLSSFRKVMDNWTTICNKSVDRLESLQYFKEEVFPELALVENCFNTENIFRYDLQNENTDKIYLFAGEITKTAILNYYTALEILTHEERITLENKLQEEGDFERRIPMMIVANERDLILPIKDAVDEIGEKIIKRKFIAAGE